MAYMNQEKKAKIALKLKEVMPQGWKYSLSVRNHSAIICTVTQAPVDLIGEYNRVQQPVSDYVQVNPYYVHKQFDLSAPIIQSIVNVLNLDNHDNSDPTSDYFDCGHYIGLNIGRYDRPFKVQGD